MRRTKSWPCVIDIRKLSCVTETNTQVLLDAMWLQDHQLTLSLCLVYAKSLKERGEEEKKKREKKKKGKIRVMDIR